MVSEAGVRSGKPALDMIKDAFQELMGSSNAEDQADLLVIINELYSEGSCRCEETEAAYGDGSEEAAVCNLSVGQSRHEMAELYREFLTKLRG